jgi:hypothetical protein
MDLILRNARLPAIPGAARLVDIGIADGRIAAIGPGLPSTAPSAISPARSRLDLMNRGFLEENLQVPRRHWQDLLSKTIGNDV